MAIRAVVFDIGGVLEITPDLGVTREWETRLGLPPGGLDERMRDVWEAGSIGAITLDDVHRAVRDRLGLDEEQLTALMGDIWREYLGTPNTELIDYARGLRPRYRTGILSNSFVDAREREQEAYGFEDLVDEIVYSHESGISKPDPRSYALVCASLGADPDETVFLDDWDPYAAAAREAGIHAICYRDTAQAIEEIETLLRKARLPGERTRGVEVAPGRPVRASPAPSPSSGSRPRRRPGTARLRIRCRYHQ